MKWKNYWIFLFCGLQQWAFGQVNIIVPIDTFAVVGDTLTLPIRLEPADATNKFDISDWKMVKKIKILSENGVDTGGGTFFTIFCTDTGNVVLAPVRVAGAWGNAVSKPIQLTIFPPDLTAIKPILEEERNFREDILPILMILGAVLLLGALFFWIKRRNETIPAEIPRQSVYKKTASEIAFEKLKILEQKQLWQQGKTKEFQTDVTFIVREYLENRFGIAALESTTDELMTTLENRQFLDKQTRQQLRNVLEIADLQKFADMPPPISAHQIAFDTAKNIVNLSKEKID
ncbi:MAG: hypothetical protein RL757_2401 [Bacteroidota bacterium]|jgi:LPXTG-motif cell wall-anchored protein